MSTATLRAVHFDFSHPEKQKKYASGGLAAKAEDVRKGVGPSHDTVLLHVNPQEYEFMKLEDLSEIEFNRQKQLVIPINPINLNHYFISKIVINLNLHLWM